MSASSLKNESVATVDQASALRGMMMSAAAEATDRPTEARSPTRTCAMTSGKGGVGKTTVCVNLAIQLSQLGRRVLLLDADLGTANADVLCDLSPNCTLAHVAAGRRTLEQAIVQCPGGFELIPGASGLAQMADLAESQRAQLMQQMSHIEARADLILIDTGAGVGSNVLNFTLSSDEALVVTTPEPTAITDAYAMIKTMSRRQADPNVRVLVNMVRGEREGRQVFERIAAVCRRFLGIAPGYAGHIVADPRVQASVRRRRPFMLDAGGPGPAAACINRLAHRMERHTADAPAEGLLRRMAGWLGR